MSRYSTVRFLLVVGAFVAITVFVYCKPWRHRSPEERAENMAKRIAQELDLTSSQMATLTKIKEEMIAGHVADRNERSAQFHALTELVRAESIDRAKLQVLKKRHNAVREKAEQLFLDKFVELHGILTPDQRTKAAAALLAYEKKIAGEK